MDMRQVFVDERTDEARAADDERGSVCNMKRTAESHRTKERLAVVATTRHDHAVRREAL